MLLYVLAGYAWSGFLLAAIVPCSGICHCLTAHIRRYARLQGMQDLRVLHSSGSKAAVQHPALVLALQDKISHLRSSLQEKNRIWFDFYATAFQVCPPSQCVLH